MRQCEYEEIYDPKVGKHVEKHIFGEGMTDIFKAVGRKLIGKTAKEIAKKAATTAATKAAEKTGEHIGNIGGEKIVELLSTKRTKPSSPKPKPKPSKLTQEEAYERVNQLLSGGKLRKRNLI